MKITLREKTNGLVKLLNVFDCFSVVLLLWILARLFSVPWTKYYSYLAGASFFLCFITFYSFQLYRSWRNNMLLKEFLTILAGWAASIATFLFLFFLFKASDFYSRSVVLTWFFLAPFMVFGTHLLIRYILRAVRSRGGDLKSAVIVGGGSLGITVADCIENTVWAGIKVVGFFDNHQQQSGRSCRPVLGKVQDLPAYLKKNSIDYIYIALPLYDQSKISFILKECRTLGAEIFLVPDLYMFRLLNAEIQSLGDVLLLNFNPSNRPKRYFDIGFSLFALIVFAPIFLLIMLLRKLEDGGPIFYEHTRVTLAGKPFKCLKFRTMHVDADKRLKQILDSDPKAREEWERKFKLTNDPRITPLGRFLRRTSLDELPQFINVLRGDMSVVGARPVVEAELSNYYREDSGLYCSMKPGITGLWQIGKRSDTEDYEERVRLDTWYVLHYSMWLDLKIIFKTIQCMMNGRGAY